MHNDIAEILITEKQLAVRVSALAAEISAAYADQQPVLVAVLKGSVVFMADLIRSLTVPHAIDFMATSSYGAATESTGVVRILKDLDEPIEDQHVLIVEDIIDSGRTLSYICGVLQSRQPASLKICTLLNKYERREIDVALDYVGFDIPNEFVFGYGLDVDEYYRNLPFIGVLRT